MHWFHDINMDTPINDIGWTYVIMAALILFLVYYIVQLIKEWKK